MRKSTIIIVVLATISASLEAKPIPSFASCQKNILSALDHIQRTTATFEEHLKAPIRTRRDENFKRPEKCKVSKPVLDSMYNELNATLNAAEPEAQGTVCTPSGGGASSDTGTSCQSVLKLIQCGVSHLKAAYASSHTVATLEQQAKWESVVNVLTRDTSKVIANLKESLDQKRRLELEALSSKLHEVKATLSCMEEVIRAKIEDTVVDKILLGEPGDAGSWFKQLKVDAELLKAVVSQAFNRVPNSGDSKRVENAAKVLEFLVTLNEDPQLGTLGASHLIKEMKVAGTWPNAYVQFKALLRRLESSKCLPIVAQMRLYSLQRSLDQALERHISATADLITAGNTLGAKDFFVNKIGYELGAFKSVVASAHSQGTSVTNVISFLEKLNDKMYSAEGLRVLFEAMKSNNNQVATAEIFKLNSHYKSMHLSDSSLLTKVKDAIGQVYDKWATNVLDNCEQLESLASQHGGNFNAFEVIRRGYYGLPSRADKVADCIEKLPWILHGIEGYGGLLKKLDELDHIDTYEYMGVVQRFKDYAESKKSNADHYPGDIVQNSRNTIPSNVRNFFFNSGTCNIVSKSEGECLAVKGKAYYGTIFFTDYRYDTYLSGRIGSNDDCELRFRRREGHLAEYQIVSERTDTFFYVSGGGNAKCGNDCRYTHFWGTPNAESEEFNSWFKFKPYGRGSKFSIMNTYYPGALYATGEGVFSADKNSVDVTVDDSRDFWTVSC